MNVADLQRHLTDLRRLLEAAGVKGAVITDLEAIGDGLVPFQHHSLRDFAGFLVRAEAFSRGEVPVTPPRSRRTTTAPRPRGKQKAPPPDPAALAQEAKRLYDQATDPAITADMVDTLATRLGELSKAGLMTVAAVLELKVAKSATKDDIVKAIPRWIMDRKGSYQRAGLLDKPAGPQESGGGH
jgi:hypothetical protein